MAIEIKNKITNEVIFKSESNACSGLKIRNANLSEAFLFMTDLSGSDLRGTDLRNSNLYGAIFTGANLYGTNLSGADLREATLRESVISGANLRGSVISDGFTVSEWNCFHHVSKIGSERGILELYHCTTGWFVRRGCFSGSKEEFLQAVEKTHGDNGHGQKYKALIAALCD